MILFNCLSNPSPSQPGKSFTIAQIQAFVIADQNCFGNMTVLLRRSGSFPSPITCSCLPTMLLSSRWVKKTICTEILTLKRIGKKEKCGQSLPLSSPHCIWTQDWSHEQFMPYSPGEFLLPRLFYPIWAVVGYCWVVTSTGTGSPYSPCRLALKTRSNLCYSWTVRSWISLNLIGFLSYLGSLLVYLMVSVT